MKKLNRWLRRKKWDAAQIARLRQSQQDLATCLQELCGLIDADGCNFEDTRATRARHALERYAKDGEA